MDSSITVKFSVNKTQYKKACLEYYWKTSYVNLIIGICVTALGAALFCLSRDKDSKTDSALLLGLGIAAVVWFLAFGFERIAYWLRLFGLNGKDGKTEYTVTLQSDSLVVVTGGGEQLTTHPWQIEKLLAVKNYYAVKLKGGPVFIEKTDNGQQIINALKSMRKSCKKKKDKNAKNER